jgi:hypothetical protein
MNLRNMNIHVKLNHREARMAHWDIEKHREKGKSDYIGNIKHI